MAFVSNYFKGQSLRGGVPPIAAPSDPVAQSAGAPVQSNTGNATSSSNSFFNVGAFEKYRTPVVVGVAVLVIATFLLLQHWLDSVFSSGRKQGNVVFVEKDPILPPETRNVEDARSSAGFLGQIFCRGGKRSKFCY